MPKSDDIVVRVLTEMYRREMERVNPAENDDSFFDHHNRIATQMKDAFQSGTDLLQDVSPLEDSLQRAFLDVIDLNWNKGEEICNESLVAVENTVLYAEGEDETQGYWDLMKRRRQEFDLKVGPSIGSKMVFVRLKHLDERQEADIDVLMKQIQNQQAAAAASAYGRDSDEAEVSFAPSYETGDRIPLVAAAGGSWTSHVNDADRIVAQDLETAGKELKLQTTWGRLLLFYQYWTDCRKETISILEDIRDLLQEADFRRLFEMLDTRAQGDAVYAQIVQASPKLPMQFAHAINNDFRCYELLFGKLQEFLDLVKCKEYLRAFGVEPKDLFLNISTFQADFSYPRSSVCTGLNITEDILQWERSEAAQMLSYCSRPLFHLIELFQKLSGEGVLNAEGIQTVIDNLNREHADMSVIVSESLLSFLDFASQVSDAVESLRKEIKRWLPKREDTIAKINEVMKTLHKTTKDVAITQTVSSSVGIAGGVIVILGFALIPVTFGASLIPAAIAGGVIAGAGAVTGFGAAVADIVIDKTLMEKTTNCLKEDKDLLDGVTKKIRLLNWFSTMLRRYIPQDELEVFVSSVANPQSVPKTGGSSASSPFDPKIIITITKLLTAGGQAVAVGLKISRMVLHGAVAVSRVAVHAMAYSFAAVGIALDIVNLVVAGVKLGKGARSENAEKLEEVVAMLEEEKKMIAMCLEDIECNS